MDKNGNIALKPIMRMMANMLALALFAIFVTYTEEVEHPITPTGNFVVEVEYNHLDLPASVLRSQSNKQVKIQRLVFIPTSLTLGLPELQSIIIHAESKPQVDSIHPLIFSLLKLVVSSNAP
ncbi:MAG TPA: hypothetical protein VK014_05155 [Cyclobacteriaceae bacterium]|nr:hypothetical protein [Cyclobacteriaceae bacterium]